MALKHICIFGSLIASFFIPQIAVGQINVPGPRFKHKAVEEVDSTSPFATPGVFDYDTQVFAPIEFGNGEERDANTGFYASIDKTYTSITKAGSIGVVGTTTGGNGFIWGTRMEAGWMTESDSGWGLVYQSDGGAFFVNGQDSSLSNATMVNTNFDQFELNKTFRQSLRQGGYFEPYIGGRFMSVSDETIHDNIFILTSTRFKQKATNNAFGLQAGARFSQNRGRWRTTADGAIVTAYNQQRYFATDILYPAVGAPLVSEQTFTDQSFVPVLDGQFEIAYHISRDLAVRLGVQTTYLWDGIARANTLTPIANPNSNQNLTGSTFGAGLNSDSFIAAGFIFGVEWKR